MAWVIILPVRQGCRLGRYVLEEAFDFLAGAVAPDVGTLAKVYEWFTLCSLGSGWPSRAASWLESERW
jgi:hypothetical protein